MLRYAVLSVVTRRYARTRRKNRFWLSRSGSKSPLLTGRLLLSWWMSAKKPPERTPPVVEVLGTMYFKRRGDKLYFNLFADEIRTAAADAADKVEGKLSFRGKVGQNIEEKRDRKEQPYTMFSAFSAEKVEDGFEYQWVRFFCFGKEREAWLQPGVRVEARGEMTLSAHNGKVNVSCRAEELAQHVADSSNSNE